MFRVSLFRISSLAVLIVCGLFVSPVASADCCPGGGHGAPKAESGLGESYPAAIDVAADPFWQVYEFEKNGIQYVQVNDQNGVVRAAVGRIENTFWVLPIGNDAERVMVPGDGLPTGLPKVLFRSQDVEVMLYQDETRQRWVIRPPTIGQ